jgi:hypothetical protein
MRIVLSLFVIAAVGLVLSGCDDHSRPKTKPKQAGEQEKVAQNDPAPPPAPNPGKVATIPKKGTTILTGPLGQARRLENKTELRGILTFYVAYCTEAPNPGQRTLDGFLASIKRDSPAIHAAIKDGYYKVNLRAAASGTDVIAYEHEADSAGHLSILGNGDIVFLPEPALKKALGTP